MSSILEERVTLVVALSYFKNPISLNNPLYAF